MAKGRPAGLRLETAARTQIEFQQSSLDDLLAPDHRARQVWDYVEELDLSVLYGRVQTTVSSSGRPAIDPPLPPGDLDAAVFDAAIGVLRGRGRRHE